MWTLITMDTSKDHEHLVRIGVAETANLFLRRELFDRVDGFAADVSEYGDYDFAERCVRSGAKLVFASDAVVQHPTRDRASGVLRAQWIYCRGYAERTAIQREQIEGLKLRTWIPVLPTIRARRRSGLALTIATRWLASNGVQPTWRERVLSLPLMYLLLPYWRNVAQVVGAVDGVRRRRALEAGRGRAPSS